MAKSTYSSTKTRNIVATAVFTALAFVCTVVFHFKAGFLSFDLKDSVMTVGAMMLGSWYGLAMVLVVSVIEAVTISGTGIYGLIMNVLSSATFVCIGSMIYSRKRTLKRAVLSMCVSVLAMVAVMLAANLVITPFYLGVSATEIAAMMPTLFLPFNLVKGVFNASVAFMLYRPILSALSGAGFAKKEQTASAEKHKFSPVPIIVAAVVATGALVVFFVCLNGTFAIK